MTRVLNKLARRGGATRGLVALLVVSLLTALVFDLAHHAAHAGQPHQPHATAAIDGQPEAARQHAAVVSLSLTTDQHDWHAGSNPSGCDCCAATCLMLMSQQIASLAVPSSGSQRLTYEPAAMLNGPPSFPERPPIAIL
jgi:glutathione S-transferase